MSKYGSITTGAELDKALSELRKEVRTSGRRLTRRYNSFTKSVSPITAVTGFLGRPGTTEFLSGVAVAISLLRKLRKKKKSV